MMKEFLKKAGRKLAPGLFGRLWTWRVNRYNRAYERRTGLTDLAKKIYQQTGGVVQNGPFQGMKLPESLTDRHLSPYLLGTYELELHPIWEEVLAKNYPLMIDVGCALGYYAVGMAIETDHPVIAFDLDPGEQQATLQLAKANGVSLQVEGRCTPTWLQQNVPERSFVLSDCEGYEQILLDPDAAPVLRTMDILAEIHEKKDAEVGRSIMDRFESTHRIRRIDPASRDPAFLEKEELSTDRPLMSMNELRDAAQYWLWMSADNA